MPHVRLDTVHPMALRKLVGRLTPRPVEDLDREKLDRFRCDHAGTALDEVDERQRLRAAGEVRSVRIVPRSGAPALEVLVHDGRGAVTAVFLGRRRIEGLSPGRRVVVEGLTVRDGRRLLLYNPLYELL